ncbi:hypothetical protein HRG_003761 [Hirsutella rhossiliensis]|uniref:DUF202 domain-containing protein n=1 Tax=Hirsutella rhossiliensis TaxID=111463 RepID=A0A9P8N2L7_9HYPO|nr:uncharacterized protein HRG_03761 [Hirsutella rhossiliensis]KAH0965745.1 hypothetical protein HRG_03761 [Hirsutella rhossiliensis]
MASSGGGDAEPRASASVAASSAFCAWPLLGPLLFENETSDARDHCANERTFLSYLRLAVYMAVLSIAITLSFHLTHQPSDLERRMAKPLGLVFWLLSVATLFIGLGNYITTINKYGRRAAIVQTGWRTQLLLAILALCIIGTCVVLIVVPKLRSERES